METRNLLLDTQVFVTNNFDMSSRVFERLEELAKEERVQILITDVTVREVERRIKKSVESSRQFVNRISKEARILLALKGSSFANMKESLDRKSVV